MVYMFMWIIGMVVGLVVSVRLIGLLVKMINAMFDKATKKMLMEEAND